jgi:hypothetical protein
MNNIIENNDEQFANSQGDRDLRVNSDATESETQLDAANAEPIDADERLPDTSVILICPGSNHGEHEFS